MGLIDQTPTSNHMKYLSLLLHIYQPPTQLGDVIDRITRECYHPLSDILNSEANIKVTLNINYSLTELLLKQGYTKTIEGFRKAAEAEKIEFTASGAYHPIFTLIPESEVRRQIELNIEGNKKAFGEAYNPKGVFPPEMCFSSRLENLLTEMGFKWVITDDLPYTYYYENSVPYNYIAQVNKLGVILRSNRWSNELSFHTWKGMDFINTIKKTMDDWFGKEDGYIVLAMDGETFGHHHKHYEEKFLRNMLYALENDNELKLCTISELLEHFPMKRRFIPPSTWSASMQDLYDDDPYPLWQSKFNHIHKEQWNLVNHILAHIWKMNPPDEKTRRHMDKALYSCQFWWASSWQFDPGQIYRGAFLLLDALQSYADVTGDTEALRIGRELYNNVTYAVHERIKGGSGK
jgi:predicted glycosyl hydrolase (DUF1957 family)